MADFRPWLNMKSKTKSREERMKTVCNLLNFIEKYKSNVRTMIEISKIY